MLTFGILIRVCFGSFLFVSWCLLYSYLWVYNIHQVQKISAIISSYNFLSLTPPVLLFIGNASDMAPEFTKTQASVCFFLPMCFILGSFYHLSSGTWTFSSAVSNGFLTHPAHSSLHFLPASPDILRGCFLHISPLATAVPVYLYITVHISNIYNSCCRSLYTHPTITVISGCIFWTAVSPSCGPYFYASWHTWQISIGCYTLWILSYQWLGFVEYLYVLYLLLAWS